MWSLPFSPASSLLTEIFHTQQGISYFYAFIYFPCVFLFLFLFLKKNSSLTPPCQHYLAL